MCTYSTDDLASELNRLEKRRFLALHLIPEAAMVRYTAAPSTTKIDQAVSLQNTIRSVLGSDYETFLQGSYRNTTGVADINDVDIVALHKDVYSGIFSGRIWEPKVSWDSVFSGIQSRLEASPHYKGRTTVGDKCITVNTNFKADVVPAVMISDVESDPIAICSRRTYTERKNYPRVHYQNNVTKQSATASAYKPTVRMFKRWTRNWFHGTKIAPSFYVECLIYNVPNYHFSLDPAVSYVAVADYIVKNFDRYSVIKSVAGDKDILTSEEWAPDSFERFQLQLSASNISVARAINAATIADATMHWKAAFRE